MDNGLAAAGAARVIRGAERDRSRRDRGRDRLRVPAGEAVDNDGVRIPVRVTAAGQVPTCVRHRGVDDEEVTVALVDDGAPDDRVGFDLLRR